MLQRDIPLFIMAVKGLPVKLTILPASSSLRIVPDLCRNQSFSETSHWRRQSQQISSVHHLKNAHELAKRTLWSAEQEIQEEHNIKGQERETESVYQLVISQP